MATNLDQLQGSSPEKVRQLREVLAGAAAESQDEQTAQLAALYTMVGPALEQFLPLADADALDGLLLSGAEFFLQLRSDAPAVAAHLAIDAEHVAELEAPEAS